MATFPNPADLPPASMPWVREVQARMEALEADNLRLKNQIANVTSASPTPQGTLSQPDLVNQGVLIGDAPTLYVEPYAYFTRSGQTLGGLDVSWDYRGANGELLAGPAERFEVWVREVRVESDYPAFADMRVDPPPTGDSSMALSTQSMYGVVQRLDIQTTYAVKVRSMTSLGVPGNFSDETIVTTPKEPRLRPIDPPILDEYPDGVSVGYDWTQYFDPGTPGYPDALGFNADSVTVPLTGDEQIFLIAAAPNGRLYLRIEGTGSLRYVSVHPDGTVATFNGSQFLTTTGKHFEVHFAAGPDGNLYSLTMNDPSTVTSTGQYKLANVADPSGIGSDSMEVVWKIDTGADLLAATASIPHKWVWPTLGGAARAPGPMSQPVSTPDGIAWITYTDYVSSDPVNPYRYSIRELNTGTFAHSVTSLTGTAPLFLDTPSIGRHWSTRIFRTDPTTLILPMSSLDGHMSDHPPQWPLYDSRDYVTNIAFFDLATNSYTVKLITPPSGWDNRFHVEVIDGVIYGKEEGTGGLGGTCRIEDDGAGGLQCTPVGAGSYDKYFTTGVGDWVVGSISPARDASWAMRTGLAFLNKSTGYSYYVQSNWTSAGIYSTPYTNHALMPITGDDQYIFDNSPYIYDSLTTQPDLDMGVSADGKVWAVGHLGVAYLSPTLISGDPGTPSFPLNPETPWPEIKYVVAQRLTVSGWIDVGTYLGPGTINDPLPAGTYSYRLVPVSTTGQRGEPTAFQTITIT